MEIQSHPQVIYTDGQAAKGDIAARSTAALVFRNQPLAAPDQTQAILALSRLVRLPIRRARIINWRGGVALFEFEPHGYRDPVLPVPVWDVSVDFRQAAFEFVRHILRWERYLDAEQNHRWYMTGYEFFSRLGGAMALDSRQFTRQEYGYCLAWYEKALVSPDGKWGELIGGGRDQGDGGRWR